MKNPVQSVKCLLVVGGLAAAIPTAQAWAGKADDTLKLAFTKELQSIDAYYNSAREGTIMDQQIWDGLVYLNPDKGEFEGNLATSWEWIDDTTLEFKLRKGVTFHNGEAFDADDVVHTLDFVTNPDNKITVPQYVSWIESTRKIDQYTVRILLKKPYPAALNLLATMIPMYPNEYYAKVGPSGMALHPVGTGPYAVTELDPGKHFVLKKYAGYHEGPKGRPSIGTIDVRTIPDVNTQIAEMFSGNLNFMWGVPSDQAEKLAAMKRFTVVNAPTMRVGYLVMDAAGRTGKDNPFTKLEVRQAVNYAIDREAIVKSLVKGSSTTINAACYPSQFGCEQDVVKYPYDPAKAKELLAKAGYPNGFATDFYAYRDRPYAEAMLAYLDAVGIKANLKMLQFSALTDLRMKGEVPFSFQTWGSSSIDDVTAITSLFFTKGLEDYAQDDQVNAALGEGDTSVQPEKRKAAYSKALKRIAEQAFWAPLFSYNASYVFTPDVAYQPTADELLRFYKMSWK